MQFSAVSYYYFWYFLLLFSVNHIQWKLSERDSYK